MTTYRFRYAVLLLSTALVALCLISLYNEAVTVRAASLIQWGLEKGHKSTLPPLRDENYKKKRPKSPFERHRGKRKGKKSKSKSHGKQKQSSNEASLAVPEKSENRAKKPSEDPLYEEFFSWRGKDYKPRPKPPYKPPRDPETPVPDPFPLLSQSSKKAESLRQQLKPPAINEPPNPHVSESTPLFIGFTRNWPQLLQCVASYIAAGWPPEDIHVVENTGVMYANRDGKLTLQNPFYLNHTQMSMLGVNVIITPTLLTFAQLQNFFVWTALQNDWPDFFWSHQDVLVFSYEDESLPTAPDSTESVPYSLYSRAVGTLRYLQQPEVQPWANHFFAYDHLTLVHRDAILDVGGWDTHIPFYATDCDMYDRLLWAGYWQGETAIGVILDVSTVLKDIAALFRLPGVHATFAGDPGPGKLGEGEETGEDQRQLEKMLKQKEKMQKKLVEKQGETWEHLVEVGKRMRDVKYIDGGGWRNNWQQKQTGGKGEPFYRDPDGFQAGIQMFIETGRKVFAEKWGHRGCDIVQMGIKAEDAWKLENDWDPETEGSGSEGDDW